MILEVLATIVIEVANCHYGLREERNGHWTVWSLKLLMSGWRTNRCISKVVMEGSLFRGNVYRGQDAEGFQVYGVKRGSSADRDQSMIWC